MKKSFTLFTLFIFSLAANGQVGTATVTPTLICAGNTVTLAASGQYSPTSTPNWQFSANGVSGWANLAPTQTASVSITGVGLATGYYRFLPNSTLPANATQTVYLTVDAASTGTVTTSATVCSGINSGTLTAAGTFTSVNYWESSTDGGATWSPIVNATTSQSYTNLTSNTGYRANVSNGTCPAINTTSATITVNPTSVGGTTAGTTTVCAGTNSGSITLSGSTGTIAWQSSTNGGVSWGAATGTTNSTTYNYANLTTTTDFRAVLTSGVCASANSTSVTITVTPSSVGGAIAGAASVCASANAGTLTLSGHTGSVVRWELSTDGGSNWSNIANTTTTLNYSSLSTTTIYRALIQSGSCASIYSSTSTITVSPASVGGTTSGGVAVCDGTNSGTLSLTGNTGSIVWQSSIDGGVNWGNAAGTTNSQFYNFSNILLTTDYRAVVTSGVCSAAYSTVVTVTVTPSSVGGAIAGAATVCASANSGSLTLSGNTGSVVRWESSIDGGSTWSNISNTTTTQAYSTLTVTTTFRARIQSGSCAAIYSSSAIITVTPSSVGGTVSGAASACSGTNSGTLTLSGYTGSIVRWQSSIDGGVTWSNIAASASATYNYSNLTATTDFRANVQSGSCAIANSADATITIFPVSVSGSITPVATTVCSGNNYGVLTLSGYTGNIVNWEKSINNGSTWSNIANTTDTISYLNLTVKTIYRALVQSGACTAKYTTVNGTISINPATVGGTASTSDTVCSGSNSGTLQLTGYIGSVIRWQQSTDGGVTWANATGTTASPIYNYSNLTATTNFRANVQSGSCLIANSSEVIITVFPISVGGTISTSATVCSGSNNGTLQLINYVGNVVRWEKSIDNGFSWTNIANTTDTNSYSNLTVKTIYRALVQSGACTSKYSTANATITVNAPSAGGTVSGTDTICSGSNSGSLILSGYVGAILRWQSSIDGGVTWTNIANTTAIYNYANITSTTSYRAVVQNGGTSGCPTANSTEATITVFPLSVGGALSPVSFNACSANNSGTIVLSGQSGNVLRWEYSIDGGVNWTTIVNTAATQNFQNNSITTKYRAIIQNGQCNPAYSAVSTINVFPATVGGTVIGGDTVCTGTNNGSLTLSGFTGSILRWELSTDGGVTWTATVPADSTAILNYTNLSTTTMYRAVLQSGSCSTANSTIGTILVNPASVGGIVNSSAYVCDSITVGTLTLTGYTGTIVRWEKSINGGVTWSSIANTTNSQIYTGITVVTMYRAIVKSGTCSQATSSTATIGLAVASNASFTALISPTVAGLVTFTNTSTSNNGTSTWHFGDGTSSTITNPAHTYTANANYVVTLIVSDSCGGDSTATTVIIGNVSVNELAYNNPNVSIYPNPFNSNATVEINFEIPTTSSFKMFDIYGKEVKNISVERGTKSLKLERGTLSSGLYFYKLQSSDETIATGKIVIQ